MHPPFDERELEVIGQYRLPGLYGGPDKVIPKFNRPIPPRENILRYLRREDPLWMPDMRRDCATVCPYVLPDAYARAFGGTDCFGIQWTYEPNIRAAMVTPGTRRLSDITRWEEELDWFDLRTIDWQKDVEEHYAQGLSPDRFTTFVILNGFFERTADLTSFEDAFCYLLEEPEALTAFYDRLAEWHIELIRIAREFYHADMILLHDDMGSQKNAFFSSELYRSLLLPQYRKVTDAAHAMGLYISLHSCGNVGIHIPDFIDAGFDGWEGQDAVNDKQAIMDQYGDRLFQMNMNVIDPSVSDEEAVARVRGLVDGLGRTRRLLPSLLVTGQRSVSVEDAFYRYSRLQYGG